MRASVGLSDPIPGLRLGRIRPFADPAGMDALMESLKASPQRERSDALMALIHLWHDHWDEAHALVQNHEGHADCDFVHGMGHRREGDFANAKYWFDGAGHHPALKAVAGAADSHGAGKPEWRALLIRDSLWQPKAFVDLVKAHPRDEDLISLQALEFRALADLWWP